MADARALRGGGLDGAGRLGAPPCSGASRAERRSAAALATVSGSLEALMASALGCAMLLLLVLFPWGQEPDHEYCVCGADLGPSTLPALVGPSPLRNGSVLSLGNEHLRLNGRAIAERLDSPSARNRLYQALVALRSQCPVGDREVGEVVGAVPDSCARHLVLRVDRDVPVGSLQPCLDAARQAGFDSVDFMLRKSDGNWLFPRERYSTARVQLGGPASSPFRLDVEPFAVFQELAHAVILRGLLGFPVVIDTARGSSATPPGAS
jgi:hypothetical protein